MGSFFAVVRCRASEMAGVARRARETLTARWAVNCPAARRRNANFSWHVQSAKMSRGNSTAPKRTLGGFIENIIDQPINFLPKRNGIFISTLISPVVIDQGPVKYRASRHIPQKRAFRRGREKKEDRASELPRARSRPTPFRLQTSYRTSVRALEMDRSIRAKFPDDEHVLGPFLGNLPPEILDVVVKNLGWFRTTFAMAGRTCSEAVERVPSTVSYTHLTLPTILLV